MTISRRLALKMIGMGSTLAGVTHDIPQTLNASEPETANNSTAADSTENNKSTQVDRWQKTHNRVWLGEQFWANPMEDWRIADGAVECLSTGGNRTIHLLTHQFTQLAGTLEMSVELQQIEQQDEDGGAGFKLGLRSELNEYRSNCFANGGLNAGVVGQQLVLGGQQKKLTQRDPSQPLQLYLSGRPAGDQFELTLRATAVSDNSTAVEQTEPNELGSLTLKVDPERLLGNIALCSNFRPGLKHPGARYRFRCWEVSGSAFAVTLEQQFGPILWSMYSLSDSRSEEGFVLKLTALTGPLGEQDSKDVELHVKEANGWKNLGSATLDPAAWTATFRIPNWQETENSSFKLVYREQHSDGSQTVHERAGTIKANPADRPLRMGALTCQHDSGFPYAPVAENLLRLDPDLLYFSGDQLYEQHGGFGVIRDDAKRAILNYLRKFYMFGWAFGEAMRDRPTLCIPDDHDVYHGNLWGEAGAKMTEGTTSSSGGYIQPAEMVNVVHKTNISHHPDIFDPTPVKQDISVYFGDMVYGGVSFAIIGDRQWKSGPENVDTGEGRADHVLDPNFDTSTLDKPGLVLLGERQEKFLEQWAKDWRGHSLKVLLSQTVFAGVATHHGGYDGYLKADLDSGAWPQTARNRAIQLIREAKPLHINGDQHLTSLVQYGLEKQRDSCWSFCTPAISVGYPRWWRPDELEMPHENRPAHGLEHTGEYLDCFGNKVYVYAIGNPIVPTSKNRYERAHQKGSGFGLVTIDPQAKTYHLEAFRFLVDATDGHPDNQFPGWPITIHQEENAGKNRIG